MSVDKINKIQSDIQSNAKAANEKMQAVRNNESLSAKGITQRQQEIYDEAFKKHKMLHAKRDEAIAETQQKLRDKAFSREPANPASYDERLYQLTSADADEDIDLIGRIESATSEETLQMLGQAAYRLNDVKAMQKYAEKSDSGKYLEELFSFEEKYVSDRMSRKDKVNVGMALSGPSRPKGVQRPIV